MIKSWDPQMHASHTSTVLSVYECTEQAYVCFNLFVIYYTGRLLFLHCKILISTKKALISPIALSSLG